MSGPAAPVVAIPEIRDYQRINAEVVRLLDDGHRRVRLVGAEAQRLLLAGVRGTWDAVIELEGRAGPELAADLDAPAVLVVCRGAAADGAARGLCAGRVLILGDAGDAVGYTQRGGVVVVRGSAGPRAGLGLAGGTLALLGPVGRLCGERQAGGFLFVCADRVGPHAGRGHLGGHLVLRGGEGDGLSGVGPAEARAFREALAGLEPWLGDATGGSGWGRPADT
jgi:glutamate synthase domain-containing protein 3